jgi:5-(carboxyamino)imidazole ribonucleotide mutase
MNSHELDSPSLALIDHTVVSVAAPSIRLFNRIKDTISVLESFKVPCEISIVAAHRVPTKILGYIADLEKKEIEVVHSILIEVVIACGCGAAHLPGMIASLIIIPVIGIPLESNFMLGLDSITSILQMPDGVSVATIGINNPRNAAILACQILGLKYPFLREKVKTYKKELEMAVETEDKSIHENYSGQHFDS